MKKYSHYYGDTLQVALPTGTQQQANLAQVATDISKRLINIFLRNQQGQRPYYGCIDYFQNNPHWHDHILFYEHFHGDNGAGIGASHQTGWTALVAKLIEQSGGE